MKGEIPSDLEINHINEIKTDNRLKNLEPVTHQKNIELSKYKKIYSINIVTKEKQIFDSLTEASIELKIDVSTISKICNKRENFKNAKSRNDGELYTLKFKTS